MPLLKKLYRQNLGLLRCKCKSVVLPKKVGKRSECYVGMLPSHTEYSEIIRVPYESQTLSTECLVNVVDGYFRN